MVITYSKQEVDNGADELSASIDIGFYYGFTNEATLISPEEYPPVFYDLSGWATRNKTMFRPVRDQFTSQDFSSYLVHVPGQLKREYEEGKANEETQRMTNLKIGALVAFKTADGRHGVLKVVGIQGGSSSSDHVVLQIKVEQKQ